MSGSVDVNKPTFSAANESASLLANANTELNESTQVNSLTDLCEGSFRGIEKVSIPLLNKPNYLQPYRDPVFGSRIVRITNSALGSVTKPLYSTIQAWNADESLLMLYQTRSGHSTHVLLDGHDYQPVATLDIAPTDIEDVFWSHTEPNVFFYVSGQTHLFGQLIRYDVTNHTKTSLANLSAYCDGTLPLFGEDVQMTSLDDDTFGFRCASGTGTAKMVSYQMSTGAVNSMLTGEGSQWQSNTAPMPTASGQYLLKQGMVLTQDLSRTEHVLDLANPYEHASLGQTHDGSDALYQVVYDVSPLGCNGASDRGVGHLVQHNLQTGECRALLTKSEGYPYTTSSTHVSALATQRPGWVALSSIGAVEQLVYLNNEQAAPTLLSEIYLANSDPDHPSTCRLAHHRSFGKLAKNATYPSYFAEPHATVSPSGTRIVFGSDWYDSGAVDSFVIELPAYAFF